VSAAPKKMTTALIVFDFNQPTGVVLMPFLTIKKIRPAQVKGLKSR